MFDSTKLRTKYSEIIDSTKLRTKYSEITRMAEGSEELTVPDTIFVSDSDDLSSRSTSRKNSVELMTSGSALSDDSTTSLVVRLRSPTPSDLARKRQLRYNPPPKGVKRGKGKEKGDPKNISAGERVNAYPNEYFSVSNKNLFCRACREELPTKKSSIESHIKSQKHRNSKKKLAVKNKEDIVQALAKYDSEFHPVGEGLPSSTRVYRIKVVTAMLKAGVPLSKIDILRDVLEEHAFALTSSSHLRQLIPFIQQEELSRIKREIAKRPISIIFDGTTHVCEAFVVVIRYLSDEWELKQCVVRLKLLSKSMTGEECAQLLLVILSTELAISPDFIVAAMRDRSSVNEVAVRAIKVLYNKMMNVGCFSHTLDRVGERMKTPILDSFIHAWIGLFSRSAKSRLLWKNQTGLSPPSYSATRWWSQFEVISQLMKAFGDVEPFLANTDLPSVTTGKLLEILSDPAKARKLRIEIAVTVDAMEPFVKATYKLEGDGALSLVAYDQLSMLYAQVSTQYYPNVVAMAKEVAHGNTAHEQQLKLYAEVCAQPAYDYFKSKFDNDLKPVLDAFKAARYFSPSKFDELKPSVADVDSLRTFSFLDSQTIVDSLKTELPAYIAAAAGVSTEIDPISWWKNHATELPNWATAFRAVILVQPSSAAAERVFSILQRFTAQQESSLEDYIELSIMLQYNNRDS